ncbi:MAG TPA: hypothetical protein VHS08_02335, partial [Candidatus Acidoferrales bacterium]|nr:hypothetical protein [Candidatus Acidoferrales bacterium]
MAETAATSALRWWRMERGDIDATVAQVGFNVAQMIIPAFLLVPVGIAMSFSVAHLLPGFALGFFVGSIGLTFLGVGLAKREGRTNVTAHVYINNVPGIIAYTLSIMLPVYLQTRDQELAWRIAAAAVVWTGIIKLVAAPLAGKIRQFVPKPAMMTVFGAAMYTYLALVLLQRIFDQPLVGIIALAIVATAVLANVPITRWRVPPFLVAWLVPLAVGLSIGYIRPAWHGFSLQLPFVRTPGPWQSMTLAIPYLSVIAPMSIYQVLQDIASVEGANSAGDNYDVRLVVACDGVGTLLCGLGGSIITPVVAALHPPYKMMGARIGFCFWTGIIFL